MRKNRIRTVFILYHFLPPDEVVSSVHFGQLASGLAARGWQVKAFTSNRMRHDPGVALTPSEVWNGVHITRVWRPRLSQASLVGRLTNGVVLLLSWMLRLLWEARRQRPGVVLFGTDPIMSIVLAPVVKLISPRTRTVQWCFDLYPEALQADGVLPKESFVYRMVRLIANLSYRRTDAIIDIGRCMRRRISAVAPNLRFDTVSPWAMKELKDLPTADHALRKSIYGDAAIACHYSGNLGHAHEFGIFLQLAQRFARQDLTMRFSVRGSRVRELNAALQKISDHHVIVDDLVPESDLENHLRTADIHLVSLRANWSGIVVPSKFFGALAVGRPVLYAGPPDSEIALIIQEEQVGWVLNEGSLDAVIGELAQIVHTPQRLQAMQVRCLELYRRRYSKANGIARFDRFLSEL